MTTTEADAARQLLSAKAVRTRCRMIYEAGLAGTLSHFTVRQERLDDAADYVADTVRRNFPTLDVPFHARWRHFVLDGTDYYWAAVAHGTISDESAERARQRFELAITSVLLDAGAGPVWRWSQPVKTRDGTIERREVRRSEGLALASLDAWLGGLFSSDRNQPCRADARALRALSLTQLAAAFQVTPDNPLDGLEGRAALLNRLGAAVAARPDLFGPEGRLGGLYDTLARRVQGRAIAAPDILGLLLDALGPIWPGRIALGGINLGDTWRHPSVRVAGPTEGLVPFHKLSQWLAYSLIEPLQEAGHRIIDIDGLTGLAEYRNGGLFIDLGVLVPRDPVMLGKSWSAGDEPIVEWRALTVSLLDEIAPLVRAKLGLTAAQMPLAAVLEGGTWSAGRGIAKELRADGGPPVSIVSDGSVF